MIYKSKLIFGLEKDSKYVSTRPCFFSQCTTNFSELDRINYRVAENAALLLSLILMRDMACTFALKDPCEFP